MYLFSGDYIIELLVYNYRDENINGDRYNNDD